MTADTSFSDAQPAVGGTAYFAPRRHGVVGDLDLLDLDLAGPDV
ncbi:hypothetical protein ACFV0C_18280 [Streptomyces sp. NPDC059568]